VAHFIFSSYMVSINELSKNLTYDPFNVFSDEDPGASFVDIRIQQRTGKKKWTLIEGLPDVIESDVNAKRHLKYFRKNYCCNGNILHDTKAGLVIQLQGDHRSKVCEYLIAKEIAEESKIRIHGW
jgi:translation initiation factor 1